MADHDDITDPLPTPSESEPVLPASGQPLERDPVSGPAPLAAGPDCQAVALDWNGEGRPDLLVSIAGGPLGRRVLVFSALGGSSSDDWIYGEGREVPELAGFHHFCVWKPSREGRFDLLGLQGEVLCWFPNHESTGPPRFAERVVLPVPPNLGLGVGRVEQLVAQDWDGDGELDLLVGFNDMEGYWPSQFHAPAEQQVGLDLDGHQAGYDRRGHWLGRAPRGRLFWLRGQSESGTPTFSPPEEIEPQAADRVKLGLRPAFLTARWGRGGSAELMLVDDSGQVRLHRNFGGQLPPMLMDPRPLKRAGKPLQLPQERTGIQLVDLDGDGVQELLLSQWDGRIFSFRAGPGRDEAQEPRLALQHGSVLWLGGGAVLAAADLDHDGDVDLIAGDGAGRLWMVEDLGAAGDHRYGTPVELEAGGQPWKMEPTHPARLHGPVSVPLSFACPTVCDWKHNNRPDLIVSGASGHVLFLRNNGAVTEPRFDRAEMLRCDTQPLLIAPRVKPAVAHWQRDSELPDLIALDLDGLLCVYPRLDVMDLDEPVPLLDTLGRTIRLDGGYGQAGRCALWAGPWTGSGRVDLLVGLPRGNRHVVPGLLGVPLQQVDDLPTVLLLENVGEGLLLPHAIRLADGSPLVVGEASCSPCGVDWRGDGTLDLLVGADDGRVLYYRRDDLRW